MESRREFLKKATILASGTGLLHRLPEPIRKALSIDPATGSSYLDAEHIVLLMQENRSFDHTYGSLRGVRGYNDPRALRFPGHPPIWLQSNKAGDTYAPFHLDIRETKATWMSSLPHSWENQVDAFAAGKQNGWLDAKHSGHAEYASMPLTMGYYKRQDIPFYYALADAFTVCDQNFCSSLTGTTPNRLYFWSGTIRQQPSAEVKACVWNGDADYDNWAQWKTFPERMEEQGIPWKVYQNEISVGVGFQGEEDAWLANFTDNPLEFFSQYNIRLHANYIDNLPKLAKAAAEELSKLESARAGATGAEAKALAKKIDDYKQYLQKNEADQQYYTHEKRQALSAFEKAIHEKAFSTNSQDPDYHTLTELQYKDGDIDRSVQVPKGDVLHQFRQDVKNGELPAVSWIVAPENFSDHPGAAWYGSWYISEVMDILTQDPEVWKKTILIIAYDENDGYFDHVPPFTVPNPYRPQSGKVSEGIDPSVEYVRKEQQSSDPSDIREHAIGLGFRVPLMIVSPWTRGGWVCSEVFDHTSTLQFLEHFLQHKYGKPIIEENISAWRRTICGDLRSAFRPYTGEKINDPAPVERDAEVERIHKAQFKQLPNNYRKLTTEEIEAAQTNGKRPGYLPDQENGQRPSCALPYELYVDGNISPDGRSFAVQFEAGNRVFGKQSAGAPFHAYASGSYNGEIVHHRAYAVRSGDRLSDEWHIGQFEKEHYHLMLYGPNGFFREFSGDAADPVSIFCDYEREAKQALRITGNILLKIHTTRALKLEIIDHAYGQPLQVRTVNGHASIRLDLAASHHWYDFTVRVAGIDGFFKRFAGRVETGASGISDPAMAGNSAGRTV